MTVETLDVSQDALELLVEAAGVVPKLFNAVDLAEKFVLGPMQIDYPKIRAFVEEKLVENDIDLSAANAAYESVRAMVAIGVSARIPPPEILRIVGCAGTDATLDLAILEATARRLRMLAGTCTDLFVLTRDKSAVTDSLRSEPGPNGTGFKTMVGFDWAEAESDAYRYLAEAGLLRFSLDSSEDISPRLQERRQLREKRWEAVRSGQIYRDLE